MWYAVYNGYPLATSDTGAYVGTAFDFMVLKDRSSFYSVFLAFTGLRIPDWALIKGSLWLPTFFQAAIVAFLLLRLTHVVGYQLKTTLTYIISMLIISIGTALSWVASYAMPDIFTGILLLAMLLYMYDQSAVKPLKAFYLIVIPIATIIHNSHFVIMALYTIVMLFIYHKNRPYLFKTAKLLSITIACVLLVCSLNFYKGFGFVISPGAHVFIVGKLAETKLLQTYLNDNCPEKNLKLCRYKSEIPPSAVKYIWEDNSPFHKIGGWESSKVEHDKIIKDIFCTPEYLSLFIKKAAMHSTIQSLNFQIPLTEQPFNQGTSPYRNISKNIGHEVDSFVTSKQQMSLINNYYLRYFQLLILLISIIWAILLVRTHPSFENVIRIYLVIIVFIICNAITTATLANVLSRLQYRVFWVLPSVNILIIVSYYVSRLKKQH